LFNVWGNEWGMEQLKKISLYALSFSCLLPIPMLFVSDKYICKEVAEEG